MSLELCVNLTGQLEREVMVQLFTTDGGDATAGDDYQSLSQTLTFVEQQSLCRMLDVLRDLNLEDSEILIVSISSNDSAVNISMPNINITIVDSNRRLDLAVITVKPLCIFVSILGAELSIDIPLNMEYFEGDTVIVSVIVGRNISLQRELEVNLTVELG